LEHRKQIRCKKIIAVPGSHDKQIPKLTEESSGSATLRKSPYLARPSSSVTTRCGFGIAPSMEGGTWQLAPSGILDNYRDYAGLPKGHV